MFVRVPFCGCVLYFTPTEYAAAVERGKRIRRCQQRLARAAAERSQAETPVLPLNDTAIAFTVIRWFITECVTSPIDSTSV